MVKAASRTVAEKKVEAKRAEFKNHWTGTLSNQGKNQAIRILIDKGIVKSKSDYYEDFLMDNESQLTQEEIDEAIERHFEEALENELEFAEKASKMENPFKNFKRKYQ